MLGPMANGPQASAVGGVGLAELQKRCWRSCVH